MTDECTVDMHIYNLDGRRVTSMSSTEPSIAKAMIQAGRNIESLDNRAVIGHIALNIAVRVKHDT